MSSSLPRGAVERLLEAAAPLGEKGGVDEVDAGRFELIRELGRGGMGVVYEAFDPELGRRVALKVLSQPAGLSTEARLRFLREAKAAAQLSHPNIAAVYDATPEAIAMQLVDGVTLAEIGRDDVRLIAELVRDAALAVHTAHQQGIVHRDLKPANLMVERHAGQKPHVYVMDFGLAKARDQDGSLSSSGILGTPHYMSPEQAGGGRNEVGAASDVYGLGVTLYATLAGRTPFESEDVFDVLRRTLEEEPPDLRRVAPTVDRDLATIVMKCLVKEPERRYPSALALASDLDRWLRGEPILARPVSAVYRFRKYLSQRRVAVKASLVVGLGAAALVTAILWPRFLAERAQREGADRAVKLTNLVRTILDDVDAFVDGGDPQSAYERLGQGIAACDEFLATTEIGFGHTFRGQLLRAQWRMEDALEAQERALALDPDLDAARLERGLLLAFDFRERRAPLADGALPPELEELRGRAVADLEGALRSEADHAALDVLLARALLAFVEGELAQAEERFIEIVQLDPNHAQAHLSLSRIYMLRGDTSRTMMHAVRATDVMRGFGAAYRAQERESLLVGSDPSLTPAQLFSLEGVRGLFLDFTEILELQPSDAHAYGKNAQFRIRRAVQETDPVAALSEWNTAVSLLDSALTLEPTLVPALNNRALCQMMRDVLLSELGDFAGAAGARLAAMGDLDAAARPREHAAGRAAAAVYVNRGLLRFRMAQLAFLGVEPRDPEALRDQARSDLDEALELVPEPERERVEELFRMVRGG